MTKRVRYDGPGPVAIFDSEASVYDPPIVANLEPGQWLPTETDQGSPMPARIRDEFAHKDNPDWTVIEQSDTPKSDSPKSADKDDK